MGTASAEIVGRDEELAAIACFLDVVAEGPRVLIVEGEAGIGKTTVWGSGVALARERLAWVLSTRPNEADTAYTYAGLADLFEDVLTEALPQLPPPQRDAIEVALLRAEGSADSRAVSTAVLNVLRELATVAPVLIAVDDVQWLDASTARALDFAVRRLKHERVLVLASHRTGTKHVFPLDLGPAVAVERLSIGPLSIDALAEILRSRLGRSPARPALIRIVRACGGNPFFALEIARALLDASQAEPGGELPLPDNLRDLVRARLARLPRGTREVLLLASALSQPTIGAIESAAGKRGAQALVHAEAADVIVLERDRIRFTHPLLSAALYAEATSEQKRTLHRRLAAVAADAEERALHLARAAAGPDENIAAALEAAAERAHARGALGAAADLAEQAYRLTPTTGEQDALRRQVTAAERLRYIGDYMRAHGLLDDAIAALEPGPLRARALVNLGTIQQHELADWERATETIERALGEVGDDLELRATTERLLAWQPASGYRARRAERYAAAAVVSAEELGDRVLLAEALAALATVEFQRGRGVRFDLIERALELEALDAHASLGRQPRWAIAPIFLEAGLLDQARESFQVLLRVVRERGEEGAIPWVLSQLADVEFRAGNWPLADQIADDALTIALQTDQQGPAQNVYGLRASLAAYRGEAELARALLEEHSHYDDPFESAQSHAVHGFLELSLGDAPRALEYFAPIHELEEVLGIGDPSIFGFSADEIEALIAVGRLDEAERLLERLQQRGRQLDRPWALATAGRCSALLLAERGDLEGAVVAAAQALREHDRLPMEFELARTLLVKGKVERRAKQKRAARETLHAALEIFHRLGAALWAKQTAEELRRIGGRASSDGLTPTERQIADLVAAGSTNREVAETMFISVKTVEANLSRIYRKLGISSRRELARVHAAQT